jgi:Tol biopolymer transport system component
MKRLTAVVVLAIVLGSTASSAQDSERLFKAAMNTELVDGDLRAAIEQYRTLTERPDRALAAKALVRMAECYQKLGNAEAQQIYGRLVREFADQPEAALARARLSIASEGSVGITLKAIPRSNVVPGTVSPDGRYLTFASWSDGNLYLRDLRTGIDRQLTEVTGFNVGLSAISTDATLVAYQSYEGGCDGKGHGAALCLVSVAGNKLPVPKALVASDEILEIAPMAWSPDGRMIAVSLRRQDRTAQIGIVAVPDGEIRVLQSVDWRGPTRIFFSPDGRDLVFDLPVSDTRDDRSIAMLAVNGSRSLTVVEHPSQNIAMGWTPDASELLFASDRSGTMGLWAQPFAGLRPTGTPRFIRGDLGGAWSLGVTKDGALYFGVRKHDRDISVTSVDLETGKQLRTPARPIRRYVGTNIYADWSRDGKYLAYVSQRGFNPTNNNGRIIGIRDMTTGEERELHPALLYFGSFTWSPDDLTLLTAGTDIKGRSGVFTIDARTAEVSLVVTATIAAFPQWSSDGKRVYYRRRTQQSPEQGGIIERDLASGAERTVVERTAGNGGFAVFSVSPDGRSLAVPIGDIRNDAGMAIVQIRIDNGESRDLVRAGESERLPPFIAPQWTPDGQAVLVRKRSPNELWLVPVTGAAPRRLDVDVRDWSFGAIGQFKLHPDGHRLAFLSGSLSNEVMVLENFLTASRVTR